MLAYSDSAKNRSRLATSCFESGTVGRVQTCQAHPGRPRLSWFHALSWMFMKVIKLSLEFSRKLLKLSWQSTKHHALITYIMVRAKSDAHHAAQPVHPFTARLQRIGHGHIRYVWHIHSRLSTNMPQGSHPWPQNIWKFMETHIQNSSDWNAKTRQTQSTDFVIFALCNERTEATVQFRNLLRQHVTVGKLVFRNVEQGFARNIPKVWKRCKQHIVRAEQFFVLT